MPCTRIFLIQATALSVAPITDAFKKHWPEAELANLLDDSLSRDLALTGELTEGLKQRLLNLTQYAEAAGADAVLFTCSAFGAAIDACKHVVSIPVLKPNEAMIDQALGSASRVALLATFEPAIASMLEEFKAASTTAGTPLQITAHHVPGAFQALQEGNIEGHDCEISNTAKTIEGCEVICFAQFSMTSAAGRVQSESGQPVLTTPDSAVIRLRELLEPLPPAVRTSRRKPVPRV
ncbi:aspartate/glutamate racemase family protein [Pseudomonas viridiflava]